VTPFLFLVLAAYGVFIGVLGVYSTRAMIEDVRTKSSRRNAARR
jgi:hypothetical protein